MNRRNTTRPPLDNDDDDIDIKADTVYMDFVKKILDRSFWAKKKYAYFMTFANLRQKWNGIKEMRSTFFTL